MSATCHHVVFWPGNAIFRAMSFRAFAELKKVGWPLNIEQRPRTLVQISRSFVDEVKKKRSGMAGDTIDIEQNPLSLVLPIQEAQGSSPSDNSKAARRISEEKRR